MAPEIKKYKDQDYQVLSEQHDAKWLFVDPEFPACFQSITHTGNFQVLDSDGENTVGSIEWRRPHVSRIYFSL